MGKGRQMIRMPGVKTALVLALAGVMFGLAAGSARAGAPSPLDGFNPSASDNVYALAIQPDGKVLLGGAFFAINGTGRNHVARLNADGSLDTTAVQTDGKVLLGGEFNHIRAEMIFRL